MFHDDGFSTVSCCKNGNGFSPAVIFKCFDWTKYSSTKVSFKCTKLKDELLKERMLTQHSPLSGEDYRLQQEIELHRVQFPVQRRPEINTSTNDCEAPSILSLFGDLMHAANCLEWVCLTGWVDRIWLCACVCVSARVPFAGFYLSTVHMWA